MTPSTYQQDIYQALITTTSHILVGATAGSGKTTTIVEGSKLIPYGKKALFVAFNKAIVLELKKRLPVGVECSTMHSLGAKCIFSHYPGEKKIDGEGKQIKYIVPYYENKNPREKWSLIYQVDRVMKLARATMTKPNLPEIEQLCDTYALDVSRNEMIVAIKALIKFYDHNDDPDKYNVTIDFQDMIEMVVRNQDILTPQYDYVFIDEVQDLSKLDQLFINRLVKPIKGRKIMVGDDHQCQPLGTKVLMSTGEEKSIEDLIVGDRVVQYKSKEGHGFWGYRGKNQKGTMPGTINEIKYRDYEGILISIDGSRYTPNHRCYMRLRQDRLNYQVLYLMEKGGYYRIGHSPLWSKSQQRNFSQRADGERADKMWILQVYESKKQAFLDEQYYSYRYGIPQLRFYDNKAGVINQEEINSIWAKWDRDLLRNRANELLLLFHRDIEYPIWNRLQKNYFSKKAARPIHACNIIPEVMEMVYFDSNNKGGYQNRIYKATYKPIMNYTRILYTGRVYSLNVSTEGNYVADGILTHNSIYQFRGGDPNSFQFLKSQPNTITLPLSISYRCPKAVVKEAKKIYDDIEPYEENEEGTVTKGKVEQIQEGDIVICRNTRPLIEVYLQLLEQDKKVTVVGKDMEKGLLRLTSPYEPETKTAEIKDSFGEKLKDTLIGELKSKNIVNPTAHPRYANLMEKLEILKILITKFDTIGQVEKFIETVFDDEERDGIRLMTIHKAKGSENNIVFLIRSFEGKQLIPSTYAVTKEQLVQEKNLSFVAATRAKKKLVYLDL